MKKLLNVLLAAALGASVFSAASLAATAASVPEVKTVQAYNIDDDEINLRWKAAKGADGYQVKVYTDGKWRSLGTTKKTYFEADDLRSAKAYKFKVRAYELKGSKRVYGKYSSVLSSATDPDEVENVKASSKTKNSVTLKWSKVPRATRYQVYLYDSAKGSYVRKVTVKANTATIKNLKAGTAYKFKVRAYYKSGEIKYKGDFSDVISVKTKSTTSASSSSGIVSKSKAEAVALNHAGLKKSQVREFSCKLDRENGVQVYEVEFEYGRYDYDYEINAKTGKIIRWEKDRD